MNGEDETVKRFAAADDALRRLAGEVEEVRTLRESLASRQSTSEEAAKALELIAEELRSALTDALDGVGRAADQARAAAEQAEEAASQVRAAASDARSFADAAIGEATTKLTDQLDEVVGSARAMDAALKGVAEQAHDAVADAKDLPAKVLTGFEAALQEAMTTFKAEAAIQLEVLGSKGEELDRTAAEARAQIGTAVQDTTSMTIERLVDLDASARSMRSAVEAAVDRTVELPTQVISGFAHELEGAIGDLKAEAFREILPLREQGDRMEHAADRVEASNAALELKGVVAALQALAAQVAEIASAQKGATSRLETRLDGLDDRLLCLSSEVAETREATEGVADESQYRDWFLRLTRRQSTGATGGGWHPDPSERHELRWWDGTQWTDRVKDNSNEGVDPLT